MRGHPGSGVMKGPSILPLANPPDLYLVSDPADDVEHLRFVEALVAGDPRKALVRLAPGALTTRTSMRGLNADISEALGRDADVTRIARTDAEGWCNLASWMVADEIKDIFVFRAQHLGVHHCERLVQLAALGGARLWLLAQVDPLPLMMRKALRFWPIDVMGVDRFEARWKKKQHGEPKRGSVKLSESIGPAFFPEVPMDEFFTFWDSAKALLPPSEFAVFDQLFQETRKETRQWARRNRSALGEETIAELLRSLIRNTRDRNMALTRLRAAQVGLFEEWIFVKANFDRLIGGLFASPPTELTAEAAARLRRLHNVRDAALATIALATPLEPAEVQTLKMGDQALDGSRIVFGEVVYEIPAHGASFLRAHNLARLFQAANPEDQLFGYLRHRDQRDLGVRGIRTSLLAASRRTGLFLAAHWTRRGIETAEQWIQRRGISVQRLQRAESDA